MTISTAYTPATSQGDGISTAFPVPWQFQFATDLVVSTTAVATGIVTPLALGTNYSVSPTSNSPAATGTVLLTVALPVGTDLTIARNTSVTQASRWVQNFSNPALLYENAVDKLTLIQQEVDYAIANLPNSGGGLGIVTVAVFNMAPIGSPQNVLVNTVIGVAVGNTLQISNVANTLIGQLLVITPSTNTLTIKTLAITAGVVGNTMPIGSPVQFGTLPGSSTIQVTDAVIAPTPLTTMTFTGSTAGAAAAPGTNVGSIAKVKMYINPFLSGNGTVLGYFDSFVAPAQLGRGTLQSGGSVLGTIAGAVSGQVNEIFDFIGNKVLVTDISGTPVFDLVGPGMVSANALLPDTLIATNSPADTQLPSYDFATGHFKWVNPGGGSSLPSGGNTGTFLVGPSGSAAWTQWFNTSLGDGAFFFGNSTATNAYAGFLSQHSTTPAGVNIAIDVGIAKFNGTNWLGSSNGIFNFAGGIAAKIGAGGTYTSIDSSLVESAIFGNQIHANFTTDIVRALGFRSGAGYWQYAFTVSGASGAITIDFKDGSYQRHTSIAGNVTVTLADTTPAPTTANFQYANELTLEINAPGANTYTWPGTVTWANGASAPTLNAGGINVLKFIRRQGQTQWVGIIINPAAGAGYTDVQARSAVLSSTYLLNSSSVAATVVAGTSVTYNVPALGITNAMLAGGIATTKLALPGGSTAYMDANGNFTVPVGSGGFSTASPHTWTGVQTYNVQQLFNSTYAGLGSSTIATSINNFFPNISSADAAGIDVNIVDNYATPPGGGGIKVASFNRVVTNTINGCNSFYNGLDLYSSQSTNFAIGLTTITRSRRLTGGNAEGVWLNSWGPCNLFSASPDAQGVTHTWTTGTVRIGEVNYGNAWQDWGLVEDFLAGGANHTSRGIDFIPDWLPGNIFVGGVDIAHHYDAQWAIGVMYAGPDSFGHSPQNHIGILSNENAISPAGYVLRLAGSAGTFNGSSAAANAPHAIIKASGSTFIGIDFAGTYDDNKALTVLAETTTGHANLPAIQLLGGHAICLRPPTGANTGTYLVDDGTHLRATRDGGNTWTNII